MRDLGDRGARPRAGALARGLLALLAVFLLGPATPALAANPVPVTKAASEVAQTSATLNAEVNPNGTTISECKFEYGETMSYGASVPCNTIPTGSQFVKVSAAPTSLVANTHYHFTITVTAEGVGHAGADEEFKTLANAPTVVTGTASEIAESVGELSATLNATVDPNGADVTECEFEYGETTTYGKSAPCSVPNPTGTSPVAVSASVSMLPTKVYHFRISAKNEGGTNTGADETFPNAPAIEARAATAVTQTTATLNATVDPGGSAVSKCIFEYGETMSYGFTVACSALPGSGTSPVAVSAPVPGLKPHTPYHFRLSATNLGGTSTGNDEFFTTLPNRPAVQTGVATGVTQTSATLSATVNPNGGEVTSCRFEYGETSLTSSEECSTHPGSGESPVAVSAPLTDLAANTTYRFRISATNAGGTETGLEVQFTTPPGPPMVETRPASGVGETTATLNASVNPNGGEVIECALEYGTTSSYGSIVSCSPAPGAGTSAVSVSAMLSGLSPGTTYHFRISATNNLGATSKGADQTFTTAVPVTPVPTPTPKPSPPPVTPNSKFSLPTSAFVNTKTGVTTFDITVSDPGTLDWKLTFKNGSFGIFSASTAKCKRGQAKVRGKCRPSRIVFAHGAQAVERPGTVSFTARPGATAKRALRAALKKKAGLLVTLTLTFQSSRGGGAVTHAGSLTIKLRKS